MISYRLFKRILSHAQSSGVQADFPAIFGLVAGGLVVILAIIGAFAPVPE